MTEDPMIPVIAERFAEAVAAHDHSSAESWAEAAFRREGIGPREVRVSDDGTEGVGA